MRGNNGRDGRGNERRGEGQGSRANKERSMGNQANKEMVSRGNEGS